jgi:hypothetical protein
VKAVVRSIEGSEFQEELARLRILVRPDSPEARDSDWQSSVWRWLESHSLADRIHRWVLDDGGKIVGHLAALPQYYRINGRQVVAHTPAEYMVLPEYGFYAIALMRRCFRTCENCVTSDSAPAVIGVEKMLGAEVAGRLQFGAKLWALRAVPGLPASVPRLVTRPVDWMLEAADSALTAIMPTGRLTVRALEDFDETFDEMFERVASIVPCVQEKNTAFLRWRYGPGSPQAPSFLLGVRAGDTLLGYAVVWVAAGGDNGYLLDLVTLPGHHEVAKALLVEAVRRLGRLHVSSIRYRFVESPTSPRLGDLRRLGFFLGGKKRSSLLVKFADSELHEAASSTARWSYNYGDGEGSFWAR